MLARQGGGPPLTSPGSLCILPRSFSSPGHAGHGHQPERTGMTRFLEFLVNHWILSGLWLVVFAALIAYVNSKSAKTVSPHQATLLINKQNGLFLDIRERKDFDKGHIVDAINIPLAKLHERITELEKKKELPIVVVCQMGQQSGEAVKALEAKGFTQVSRMSGGMNEWQVQSLPVVK
jgi:rhodanese-related sulfurtransferase